MVMTCPHLPPSSIVILLMRRAGLAMHLTVTGELLVCCN